MALKFTISKKQYDALSDEMKAEYITGEDGKYKLDVSDLPETEDVEPIKRALQAERETVKGLKKDKADLQSKIDAAPKIEEIETKHKNETAKLTNFVNKTARDSVANSIATKISTTPVLLAPKIAERLAVDMSGDEIKTVILGADGKPDPAYVKDGKPDFGKLQKEFVDNPDYRNILIGSLARGGGSPPATLAPSGPGGTAGNPEQKLAIDKLSPKEMVAYLKAKQQEQSEQQN